MVVCYGKIVSKIWQAKRAPSELPESHRSMSMRLIGLEVCNRRMLMSLGNNPVSEPLGKKGYSTYMSFGLEETASQST